MLDQIKFSGYHCESGMAIFVCSVTWNYAYSPFNQYTWFVTNLKPVYVRNQKIKFFFYISRLVWRTRMIHCLNLNMKNVMRVKINILLSLQYLDTFFLSGNNMFINKTRLPSRFALNWRSFFEGNVDNKNKIFFQNWIF